AGAAPCLRPDAGSQVGDLDGRLRLDRRRLRQLRAGPGRGSNRPGGRLRPGMPAAPGVADLRHRPAAEENRLSTRMIRTRSVNSIEFLDALRPLLPGIALESAPATDPKTPGVP